MAEPEDLWEDQLFECSFGGIRIDVQSVADTNGRVLATHRRPHRDGAPVRDLGGEPRVTRCRVIFFQVDAADDPRERFFFFKDLSDRGVTQTFVHPIAGAYRAKIGQLDWSAAAEPRNVIVVECTFHEDSDVPAVFDAGPGTPPRAGVDEVSASAAAVDSALVDYNDGLVDDDIEPISTPTTGHAVLQAQAWEDGDDHTARNVGHDLAALSAEITTETDRLELAEDLDRYPIMIAFISLHDALKRAAQSVIQDEPRIVDVTIQVTTNIYTFAASVYGAADVDSRVEQIIRLNDIPNPARLEAGSRVKIYAAAPDHRLRTPSSRRFG